MELFRLFGSILIDDENALKTLKETDKKAQDSGKSLNDFAKKAGQAGKAIAIGIGAAATALGALVVKSAQATDRVDKMSQKFGLSRKGFQEWDYILSQNGATIESMTSGMKTLTNMTDDLMKGNKKATDSFKRLGISMEDVEGKSQEEVFEMTVKALQGMENATERAAIANDLLGRSGIELAPLLNAGADSVDLLKNRANELGLVLSDEAIDAGVVFTDTMDSMKRMLAAVATQIGITVMPIIQSLLDWVMENMPTIKEVMGNVFGAIADAMKWVSDNAGWLIPVLGGVLAGIVAFKIITTIATIWGLLTGAIAAAGGVMAAFNLIMLANPIGLIAIAIGVLIAAIVALVMNFDKVKAAASKLWDGIKDIFGKISSFVTGIFDSFKNIIKLPKFEVKGSLNPLTWLKDGLPKLNVKWNADGAIFSRPTIFGTSAGFQGVGEAGSEIVAPLSKLQDMIDWNRMDEESLAKAIRKELTGFAVVLDDEKVGEFVDLRIIKGVS